jgi:hypothetical protein
LYYNTIGGNNTAHGYRALYNTTTVLVTLGTITGGSGYTDGTYTSVLMTYVSGSTAVTYPTATIVVAGGVVTTVTLTSFGVGFKDTTTVLSAAAANIGGTGSGFTVPVATISSGDSNTAHWVGMRCIQTNKVVVIQLTGYQCIIFQTQQVVGMLLLERQHCGHNTAGLIIVIIPGANNMGIKRCIQTQQLPTTLLLEYSLQRETRQVSVTRL